MWRPGKLRFLIGVKNPLPIDRPRPPENAAPCGAPPVARFATPVGLRPPFVAHPATLPHPDRRALLTLIAAAQPVPPAQALHDKILGERLRLRQIAAVFASSVSNRGVCQRYGAFG